MTTKKGINMKDNKRALRRHVARMKYIRRLGKHLYWWSRVKVQGKTLLRPTVTLVLGTDFERPFYVLRETSGACSCCDCKDRKYKRKHNEIRKKINEQLEEHESSRDRFPELQ